MKSRAQSWLIIVLLLSIPLCAWTVVGCLSPPELVVPPRRDVIISGVTVINPETARFVDHSVVIRDGIIREVRPRIASDPDPICAGCYAVPGLIDAHVHTPPRIAVGNQSLFALLYLAHGVTTVRDLGASEESVADMAQRLNSGDLVGPRMLRCGPVLDGSPPGWPIARVVQGAREGREAVDQLAADGVDCIKVYNEIGVEAFEAISLAAQRYDLPLVGHVPHVVGLEKVVDFEAQHMTGVPYLSRPRPPIGWDLRNEDVLQMNDSDIERALEVALRQRVSFTPTLANFRLRLIASDSKRFPPTPASEVLPGYWTEAWDLIAGHPSTDAAIDLQLAAMPVMRSLVRRAHERGIDILAGTDTLMPWVVPGEALHLELIELRDALGDAESALAAATTVNGRHVTDGEVGRIERGARADILLIARDPTLDLVALREWRILFADGRRYDRATLDGWLEVYRNVFHGRLQRGLMAPLVILATRFFDHD